MWNLSQKSILYHITHQIFTFPQHPKKSNGNNQWQIPLNPVKHSMKWSLEKDRYDIRKIHSAAGEECRDGWRDGKRDGWKNGLMEGRKEGCVYTLSDLYCLISKVRLNSFSVDFIFSTGEKIVAWRSPICFLLSSHSDWSDSSLTWHTNECIAPSLTPMLSLISAQWRCSTTWAVVTHTRTHARTQRLFPHRTDKFSVCAHTAFYACLHKHFKWPSCCSPVHRSW